jgi:hypothetical protein
MAGSGAWTTYDTENLTANGTDGIATSVSYVPSSVGPYNFRATYLGDDNYMTAQSLDGAAPLTVSLGSGSITNLLSQSSIGLGSSVTDSVTVPGPGQNFPAPTGPVTFQVKVGSGSWSTYDTETLATNGTNGVANSTAYLPMAVGSYSFRVLYSGDNYNKASQTGNDSAILTVNPGLGAGPVTTVLSHSTIAFGGSVTASVTVPGIGANRLGRVPGKGERGRLDHLRHQDAVDQRVQRHSDLGGLFAPVGRYVQHQGGLPRGRQLRDDPQR